MRPALVSAVVAVSTAAALASATVTAPGAAAAPARAGCTAPTGPYQRPMEQYLGRPVDGVQSEADCEAVRSFQTKHEVSRTDGYADLATYRYMLAAQAHDDPNAAEHCPVKTYRVTCVDMDRQLLWVQTGKRIDFRPVPIRTGRQAQETRPGWHAVYWRDKDHVSTIYDNAPMPYSQFFDGGQALHGHPGDLYDGGGSAGCVNLTVRDAETLWNLLRIDDAVYVWGTKPGTGA
ncbi:L,D-transpeptidase [Streptomyces sp. NPDC014734]|uniref:L,D-transpeptidase n=1 Tax=Streptomyces sp. NPDC014734 TaxID=3364886 RepID=UPI0036F7D3ED